MSSKLFLGLDLGSFSLKGILAEVNSKKNTAEILALAEVPSRGIRRGIIFDVEDAARSISELLAQFEDQVKKEITEVNILLGGGVFFQLAGPVLSPGTLGHTNWTIQSWLYYLPAYIRQVNLGLLCQSLFNQSRHFGHIGPAFQLCG